MVTMAELEKPRERASLSSDDQADGSDTISESAEENVVSLARSFSVSRTFSAFPPDINPFLSTDPKLDPNSPDFDPKRWAGALLHAFSRDPVKYPRHTAGVSYRNLGVYGFGTSTDYQKDVLNVLWEAPLKLADWAVRRKSKIQILNGFDGLAKSGEMVLVLGRPGSGVSTLLKSISGHTLGLHLDTSSEFNYQGIPWNVMHDHFRGEIIYQAETDIHFPQLTVGDTLLFAALARTPQNRLDGVSRKAYAQHLRDVVMAIFGISNTMNTKVGDDFVRGVSGGERKRVSIAEATLNQSTIQCWDNSTRGLDSATSLEFVKTLRLSTRMGGTSAIVALYQASQLAYDEFDKVAVLYEGRQMYFGPRESAKEYFTNMGYHCPDRQTTADFLTSLTNPSERIVRPGFEDKVPRTPDEFADEWRMSQTRAELLREIAAFEEQYPLHGPELQKFREARSAQQAPLLPTSSPYTISIPMQIQLCMTRGIQRLLGDKTFFVITALGNFFISLVLGSVFFDLADTAETMGSRCSIIFFAILFNGLSSALEILSLYAQRPIVEKHTRYALYRPFSEAISSTICDLPLKVISTLAFNVPLYFMSHLRRDASAFFIFLLFGFSTTLTMSMILRTIGQSTKTVHQALAPAALLILALVIYTGYILPTRNMKGWLRWINYVNPIAYGYEALVANEFRNRSFPCSIMIPMGGPYADVTPLQQTCATAGAAPGDNFIVGDTYIEAAYGYKYSHLWRNFGILVGFFIFFSLAYIFASEYFSLSPSKGEVLVFRQGYRQRQSKSRDEESADVGVPQTSIPPDTPATSLPGTEKMIKIQRQTAVFHWKDLCYDINIKGENRRILDRVNGWVKPGTLTALMGATGAGKTTLLDVLADRVTMGVVTGDVLLNGHPRSNSFQRKTGYVQQQDIHLGTSTVREALRFSAELRQPASTTRQEKYEYVEEVIRLLEMEAYADAVIGVPGEGLNVEQRKRLTIGVELAGKPDLLLFLDEPTSGLDSQTAWSITALIRKLSDHGQAILCTIHQPSAMLFQQFDRLLLLARGGKTVYFGDIGENSKVMTNYFEKFGAVPCSAKENPAEWMLRVIGAAPGAHTDRDWTATWRESPEYTAAQAELEKLAGLRATAPSPESASDSSTTYAAPVQLQFWVCMKRVFEQYWRTPTYIYAKLLLCLGNSLFIGLSFQDSPLSIQGLQNQLYSIFMLVVIFAFLMYQTMPNFIAQRTLYEGRERSSKTYSWYVFVVSNLVVEMPWNSLAALVIYLPFYFLVGMYQNGEVTGTEHERGGLMFLLLWAFMIYEGTFADMAVAGVPTAEIGATLSLLLFMMTLIFSGVIVAYSSLPGFWKFMYRVSPMTYIISAMLSDGVAKQEVQCSAIEFLTLQPANNLTCGEYLEPFMQAAGGSLQDPSSTDQCMFCSVAQTDVYLQAVGIEYDDRWRNFGLIWVYIIFNCFLAVGVYWLARVPKKNTWAKVKALFARE
ncbi:ABC-2 type transporter-domain-containing protein [Ilyonectria robusta]|uniref:ABC-2 type transporter-domain-containing protein n=1 Tax=Ilyonectria robusta TaxID=1079257 RepID=UPI001E8CC56B|nr:ABC-2 type transporter-domain-containing protein [Ilyonectria robusta]KAH8733694.1 ABC-2 type transporter-domain-containing protein [Ilyonectria robusta]